MALNFKQIFNGLRLKAKAVLTSDTKGELEVLDSDGKLYYHDGTARAVMSSVSSVDAFTNKTINANLNTITNLDVTNLEAGVLDIDISTTSALDDTIPSAKAVKTYVDAQVASKDAANEISYSNATSGLAATNVQTALDEIDFDLDAVQVILGDHIADTVDSHDASSISVIAQNGITSIEVQAALEELQSEITGVGNNSVIGPASSTDNAITRYDGTTGKLVQNSVVTLSDTGVIAGSSIDGLTNTLTNVTATTNANLTGGVTSVGNVATVVTNANLTGDVTSVGNATTIGANTITSTMIVNDTIVNDDINTAAAIARTKLASGTANAVVHNNGSGVMTDSADLLVGTNSLTLANTKHIELQAQTDAATTGSDASLAAFTAGGVRVTNASLVSLANIPAGTNGQEFVLFNRTGVAVSIVDSSGAIGTAANRILTGTSANITLAIDAALILSYDSTTARWQVVGGSGSGSVTSVVDNVFIINDNTDPTKQINFDAGGTTATKTTIAATQTANRVITLPDATTTLVGTDTTQTLTNKTIVAANNTITTAASGNLTSITLNAALAELQTDIDARVSQPNYVLNAFAEVDTTGFVTYADAAATSPVDGVGGSPGITFTRTTSSPLRGTASFLLTKDAVNRQGNGVSYDFTIDPADQGKVLQASFEYQIASGTFADNDISVWVYDITNAVLIQPAPFQLKNSGLIEKFAVEFQTATNSTSYRLIIHVASTSALAYTVKFDNFNVGSQAKLFGSAITDWIAYTPTGSWVTNTQYFGFWRRVGGDLEGKVRILTTGAPTATDLTFAIPTPFKIDLTKLPTVLNIQNTVGSANVIIGSTSYDLEPVTTNSDQTNLRVEVNNGSIGQIVIATNLKPGTWANNSEATINFKVPIQGWASSQVFSQDADTRVVAAIITGDPASATSGNPIIVPTISFDSHGAYNATTGRYTVPVSGIYKMYGALQSASAATTLTIYKNAVSNILAGNLDSNGEATYIGSVNCIAGDIIDIRPGGTVDATNATINIERISGPAQIAASESVNARYFASATAVSGTLATVNFTTKDFDSHLGYSAGTYTVQSSGKYQVNSALLLSGTFVLNSTMILEIQKNGTVVARFTEFSGGAVTDMKGDIDCLLNCIAGDTIRVQVSSSGTAPAIVSSNFDNYISLYKVGN